MTKMKSCLILLFIATLVFCEKKPCEKQCELTFPLHTSDKVNALHACFRGCRYSRLNQITNNISPPSCKADCSDAYESTLGLQSACQLGCESQEVFPTPEAQHKKEIDAGEMSMQWQNQFLQPVIFVRRVYADFVAVSSSSAVVIDNKDGGVLMMQFQMSSYDTDIDPDVRPAAVEEELAGEDLPVYQRYAHRVYHHGKRWLTCVESKAGIPFWSSTLILFLCVFFIFWVFCSSCDEEHESVEQVTKHKHVFSDGPFILADSNDLQKVPLFSAEDFEIAKCPPYQGKEINVVA